MKGNANLSSLKAIYFPGSVRPEFMGAHPPIKSGAAAEKGNINYFTNYRNENLSKFQMPPYEWGLMSKQYSPKADLVAAKMKTNIAQPPPSDITFIDPVRQSEIDGFYEICQRHRDQYKDHTGSIHPLDFFEREEHYFQCPPSLTNTYFTCPSTYVQYRSPAVLPRTLERTLRFPDLPGRTLYGRYSVRPDISYKR